MVDEGGREREIQGSGRQLLATSCQASETYVHIPPKLEKYYEPYILHEGNPGKDHPFLG